MEQLLKMASSNYSVPNGSSVTEKRTVMTSSSNDDPIYYRSSITPRVNNTSSSSSYQRSSAAMGPLSPGGTRITTRSVSGISVPAFSNVTATGVTGYKTSREKEKQDLRDLNERFANYIEKVQFLEAQNRKLASELDDLRSKWGKETNAVKKMYETELEEARKVIDDTNNDRTKLQVRVETVEDQFDDMRRQLDDAKKWRAQDREVNNKLNQQVSDLEAEIRMLRRTNDSLDTERQRDKQNLNRLNEELEKLRMDLSNETIQRLDAENRAQTLAEELEFQKSVHEQELKELAALAYRDTTAENREFWKNELSQAIRDIQSEYDSKLDTIRGEMETFYNLKVQEFRTGATKQNMEVTHAREETKKFQKVLNDYKIRIADLEARNAQLEKQYQDLLREMDQKEQEHTLEINQLKDEMNKLRAEMEAMLVELQTLMDAKLSLELEIAAYRKLLETEESRTGVPPRRHFRKAVDQDSQPEKANSTPASASPTSDKGRQFERAGPGNLSALESTIGKEVKGGDHKPQTGHSQIREIVEDALVPSKTGPVQAKPIDYTDRAANSSRQEEKNKGEGGIDHRGDGDVPEGVEEEKKEREGKGLQSDGVSAEDSEDRNSQTMTQNVDLGSSLEQPTPAEDTNNKEGEESRCQTADNHQQKETVCAAVEEAETISAMIETNSGNSADTTQPIHSEGPQTYDSASVEQNTDAVSPQQDICKDGASEGNMEATKAEEVCTEPEVGLQESGQSQHKEESVPDEQTLEQSRAEGAVEKESTAQKMMKEEEGTIEQTKEEKDTELEPVMVTEETVVPVSARKEHSQVATSEDLKLSGSGQAEETVELHKEDEEKDKSGERPEVKDDCHTQEQTDDVGKEGEAREQSEHVSTKEETVTEDDKPSSLEEIAGTQNDQLGTQEDKGGTESKNSEIKEGTDYTDKGQTGTTEKHSATEEDTGGKEKDHTGTDEETESAGTKDDRVESTDGQAGIECNRTGAPGNESGPQEGIFEEVIEPAVAEIGGGSVQSADKETREEPVKDNNLNTSSVEAVPQGSETQGEQEKHTGEKKEETQTESEEAGLKETESEETGLKEVPVAEKEESQEVRDGTTDGKDKSAPSQTDKDSCGHSEANGAIDRPEAEETRLEDAKGDETEREAAGSGETEQDVDAGHTDNTEDTATDADSTQHQGQGQAGKEDDEGAGEGETAEQTKTQIQSKTDVNENPDTDAAADDQQNNTKHSIVMTQEDHGEMNEETSVGSMEESVTGQTSHPADHEKSVGDDQEETGRQIVEGKDKEETKAEEDVQSIDSEHTEAQQTNEENAQLEDEETDGTKQSGQGAGETDEENRQSDKVDTQTADIKEEEAAVQDVDRPEGKEQDLDKQKNEEDKTRSDGSSESPANQVETAESSVVAAETKTDAKDREQDDNKEIENIQAVPTTDKDIEEDDVQSMDGQQNTDGQEQEQQENNTKDESGCNSNEMKKEDSKDAAMENGTEEATTGGVVKEEKEQKEPDSAAEEDKAPQPTESGKEEDVAKETTVGEGEDDLAKDTAKVGEGEDDLAKDTAKVGEGEDDLAKDTAKVGEGEDDLAKDTATVGEGEDDLAKDTAKVDEDTKEKTDRPSDVGETTQDTATEKEEEKEGAEDDREINTEEEVDEIEDTEETVRESGEAKEGLTVTQTDNVEHELPAKPAEETSASSDQDQRDKLKPLSAATEADCPQSTEEVVEELIQPTIVRKPEVLTQTAVGKNNEGGTDLGDKDQYPEDRGSVELTGKTAQSLESGEQAKKQVGSDVTAVVETPKLSPTDSEVRIRTKEDTKPPTVINSQFSGQTSPLEDDNNDDDLVKKTFEFRQYESAGTPETPTSKVGIPSIRAPTPKVPTPTDSSPRVNQTTDDVAVSATSDVTGPRVDEAKDIVSHSSGLLLPAKSVVEADDEGKKKKTTADNSPQTNGLHEAVPDSAADGIATQ